MKFMTLYTAAGMLAIAGHSAGHMELQYPPPLRSKYNSFSTNIDYSMTSPLSASGSDYPCKGYLSLMGTPQATAVASFTPGSTYNMTIVGGAPHNGGSCQASLSFDGGKTFTVIHSYIGGCPVASQPYYFTIPSDAPAASNALFAWTWQNNVGNREMYMNCAVVNIRGSKKAKRDDSVPFSSRPSIFVANVGNGCGTLEGSDVMYPRPGPDVSNNSSKTAPPTGNCAAAAGGLGSGAGAASASAGSGSGSGSSASTSVVAAPSANSGAGLFTSSAIATSTAASSATQKSTSTMPALSASAKASSSGLYVSPTAITVIPVLPSNSSRPGGVFITVPGNASAPTIVGTSCIRPTTFASIATGNSGSASVASGASPSTTSSSGAGSGSSSGSSGAISVGVSCTPEGEWNCVRGTEFQRCASGTWSAMIPMAAGTSCQPGMSDTLIMIKKRGGARRFVTPWQL